MPVRCTVDTDREHVARLELDFGRLNLLSPEAIDELHGAAGRVPDDVSVVTVGAADDESADGGRREGEVPGLTAGLDLDAAVDLSAQEARAVIGDLREAIAGIRDCHAVTVCGCGSYALGAGLELAMACDVRVATDDARLGLPEVDVGLVTGIQGGLLIRLVGLQAAKELVYTGEPVSGVAAAELGLVNDAVPPAAYDDAIEGWVDRLAAKSPLVLRRQKAVFRSWRSVGLERGIESSAETIAECFGTHDQREATAAFLEGREPDFAGR